ncbi:methyl-accepting chemotaxis protein, partial [Acaryochloris marina NIES-2412]|uniref:methyl-accepting chemotaxis protein n=1 Tax=Acaryochloris marina TaxID=155978 RepID=UPI004059DA3F
VAGEIRKLADQSRSSADKIGTLVGAIQGSINSTVMVTDEGNKTAASGIELTENTLNVFQKIEAAVNDVSIASQQIALSSKQQAVGVQQAVSAMNAINLGAKETATVVSQVKSSTEELTDVAKQLQVTV